MFSHGWPVEKYSQYLQRTARENKVGISKENVLALYY